MSKNNFIRKSDKKFIRREKSRIRAAVLDTKKQEEMIKELYNKFIIEKGDAKISVSSQKIKDSLNPKRKIRWTPAGGLPAGLHSKQDPNSKSKIIKNQKIKQ